MYIYNVMIFIDLIRFIGFIHLKSSDIHIYGQY
nr:MAG TPA: hypothetical protein [Caudoviricetes sp.]